MVCGRRRAPGPFSPPWPGRVWASICSTSPALCLSFSSLTVSLCRIPPVLLAPPSLLLSFLSLLCHIHLPTFNLSLSPPSLPVHFHPSRSRSAPLSDSTVKLLLAPAEEAKQQHEQRRGSAAQKEGACVRVRVLLKVKYEIVWFEWIVPTCEKKVAWLWLRKEGGWVMERGGGGCRKKNIFDGWNTDIISQADPVKTHHNAVLSLSITILTKENTHTHTHTHTRTHTHTATLDTVCRLLNLGRKENHSF